MIIVLYTDDCLLYARDTKEIETSVKTIRKAYKLTLNDPNPIYNYIGIHFSHQENDELHTSQTGLIDTVSESLYIPKGRLKTHQHQHQQQLSCTLKKKALQDKNPGTIHLLSDNLTILHRTHGQTYPLPFTNARVFSKNPRLYTKKPLNESFTTCNAHETNHLSFDAYCDSDFAGVWHQ
jgi:hypothetical protein